VVFVRLLSALARARTAAGGRDIRIGGGADLIQQYLNAGLVDEFTISIAPVILGDGTRLFDFIKFGQIGLEVIDTIPSPRATHLGYAVSRA
jgi:dihydrofolate reductase